MLVLGKETNQLYNPSSDQGEMIIQNCRCPPINVHSVSQLFQSWCGNEQCVFHAKKETFIKAGQ